MRRRKRLTNRRITTARAKQPALTLASVQGIHRPGIRSRLCA